VALPAERSKEGSRANHHPLPRPRGRSADRAGPWLYARRRLVGRRRLHV